jgi:hypothetical protein
MLPSAAEKQARRVPAWTAHGFGGSSAAAVVGLTKGRRKLPPLPNAFSAELLGVVPSLTWKCQPLPSRESDEAVEDEPSRLGVPELVLEYELEETALMRVG